MSSIRKFQTWLLITLSGVGIASSAFAQEQAHDPGPPQVLGTVHFPLTCADAVAEDFERAVAMLHSFWFGEARGAFQAVAAADRSCALAHWGVAMTEMGNPMARTLPAPTALAAGREAARRAQELARTQSRREQLYAAAALAYFEPLDLDHDRRMTAHENALRALHEAFPEDAEATIFYARAVVANAPPTDLTFSRQIAGAELMEPLFAVQPDHPGLAHYIIHAYDAPPIAARGIDAAFAYADIAPSAPHALHMPSHIFTRLGYWEESIATNARSAAAEPNPAAAYHPMDYMVYAHLQLGRDAAAKTIVEQALRSSAELSQGVENFNLAAMPARYLLERDAWAEAAHAPVRASRQPHITAISHFTRAIGNARAARPQEALLEIEALRALEGALAAQDDYWHTIATAQRIAAEAWVAYAQRDEAAALRLAQEAAELEETVEKHPVTPGPLLPARELQADLLLESGRASEALAAYERTLAREPNRARTLYGAARAAARAGDQPNAEKYYAELLTLMAAADPERPESAAARNFLQGG